MVVDSRLHEAAKKGDINTVQRLLASGVKRETIIGGQTALFWAAGNGDKDMVDCLLEAGPMDPIEMNMAVANAASSNHLEVAIYLARMTAGIPASIDQENIRLLEWAAENNLSLAKLILERQLVDMQIIESQAKQEDNPFELKKNMTLLLTLEKNIPSKAMMKKFSNGNEQLPKEYRYQC